MFARKPFFVALLCACSILAVLVLSGFLNPVYSADNNPNAPTTGTLKRPVPIPRKTPLPLSLLGKDGAPLPSNPADTGATGYRKLKMNWMWKNMMPEYDKRGKRSDLWDARVVQLYSDIILWQCDDPRRPDTRDIKAECEALIALGCPDPLVKLWLGRLQFEDWELDKAYATLDRMYPGIWWGFAKIFQAQTVERKNVFRNTDQAQVLYNELSQILASHIPNYFTGEEIRIVFEMLSYENACGVVFWPDLLEKCQARKIGEKQPWLMKMIEGETEIRLAWKDRGSGWASTVSESGWSGFGQHLAKARAALAEAHELQPNYPEAAGSMITVIMGGGGAPGETERLWLDRAIQADPEYRHAYDAYLLAMRPRWGGDHNVMLDFGKECLATKRSDTAIPFYIIMPLKDIGSEMPNYCWWAPFRSDPELNKQMDAMYAEYLLRPATAYHRDRLLTGLAFFQSWSGRHDEAKATLAQLTKPPCMRDGLWGGGLSFYSRGWDMERADIEAHTGPHRELLREADVLHLAGRIDDSIALLKKAMEGSRDRPEVFEYLRDRIAIMMARIPSEYGPHDIRRSALSALAMNESVEGVAFLLENGVKPYDGMPPYSLSPFYSACDKGNLEILKMLGEKVDKIEVKESRNIDLFFAAVEAKSADCVRYLLQKGLKPPKTTPVRGCFFIAMHTDDMEIAKVLLDGGVDPDTMINPYSTPLMMACVKGRLDWVKLFLEHKADINFRGPIYGNIALLEALRKGHEEIALHLMERGADVDVATNMKETALMLAEKNNLAKAAELIRKKLEEKAARTSPAGEAAATTATAGN
jgi:ankyrin repeat protein